VFANDDYGVPMLLTRDGDGRFAAFLNVCRHRGMRLVANSGAAESRASVVCPYHGWTYRLDGVLRHRLNADAFDRDCGADAENLVPLPCEERHGLLWVVPKAGGTIDVAAYLQGLDAEMPCFGIERLVHFRTVQADYPANWKLIVDAFLEAYHIRVLHKDTIYPFFADGTTTADRFGPHIQSLVARRAGETWANEGGPVPGDMQALRQLGTPTQLIFPNTITIFHPDYLSLITLYPIAAGSFRWMHRMLIPADRTSADWAPHWDKTFHLIEEGVFQKEDIGCAVGIQRGFASGANRFLTAGRAEQALGWFHADVAARLGAT
jgi:phenylpropionate dioxygenase-like ring-hydroxylating dioxygenase large terminal subunit